MNNEIMRNANKTRRRATRDQATGEGVCPHRGGGEVDTPCTPLLFRGALIMQSIFCDMRGIIISIKLTNALNPSLSLFQLQQVQHGLRYEPLGAAAAAEHLTEPLLYGTGR